MTIFWIALISVGVGLAWDYLMSLNVPQADPEPELEMEIDEVTVGDMVLHDMVNDSDEYDIGVIDFNE